ncbi:MAG: MBOAT family protein [Bacteroidales bacterium]|nr:MBOAT family protein [Bacteroidales bacterium]
MNWNPAYAILIFFSTFITYACSLLLEKYKENPRPKRLFLTLSLIINFGILFVFKYFNFLNESIFQVLELMNIRWTVPNFDLLLPVGISFYTFQAVGYTIDVYRGDIKAEKHFGIYALFVSFFPQLVAGPIERAKNLLPEFKEKHYIDFNRISSGFKIMLWGFFMKIVIADRLSIYVNAIYNNVDNHNGLSFILATLLFSIQIYCDFGGYSNIAIGTAKIMGFNLMTNFNRPYFALSIRDFWQRWHISLSTWFKDYLYISLGGNRVSRTRHLFNLFLTFLVSGIWHGANYTFVIWGGLHGIYQVVGVLKSKLVPNLKTIKPIQMLITFGLVVFAWIFFRANTITDAFTIIKKILTQPGNLFTDQTTLAYAFIGIVILLIKDLKDEFKLNIHFSTSKYFLKRYLYYATMITIILLFGVFDSGQFIYFQF